MIKKTGKKFSKALASLTAVTTALVFNYVNFSYSLLPIETPVIIMDVSAASSQAESLVNVALAEEGYKAGSNQDNKYGKWYGLNNKDWCAIFISWCANQAGIPTSIIKKNAWAGDMGQTQKKGNFGGTYYPKGSITPQPGDIVYYDGSEVNNSSGHVEIVISYNASKGTIDSIGGNTGGGNGAVIRHNGRSLATKNSAIAIMGFERPNYKDSQTPWVFKIENAPQCSSKHWVGKGGVTSGNEVKWVQTALNMVNNAGLTVDGEWGSKSEAATKAFQKKYGLTQDGQAGTATIKKLVELIPPSWAKVSLSKSTYEIGEKVTFNFSSDKGNRYTIGIDNANGERIDTTLLDPGVVSYTRTFNAIGSYSCYITAHGDYRLTDSPRISFNIKCSHKYGDWTTTKNPTCTAEGTKTRKCSLCGNTETETIAKTGHKYTDKVVAPTCTDKGYTLHTCSVCGNSYKDSEKNAIGHSYGSWTVSKAATCTTDGTETHKCTTCNYSESRTIAKTGHKYTDKVIAPSCVKNGYTLHTCSKCGDSYNDNETAVIGHSFVSEMTDGYMTYTCSECGYTYTAPFKGEGTEENPFVISNADELRAVSETVNNTKLNPIFGHAHYRQTADIDLENISWTPIGLGYDGEDGKGEYNCNTRMFFGVYDGNKHNIYNLNVDKEWKYSGLFGAVRSTGSKVCNVVAYGNINRGENSGGIAAETHYYAIIENCAFIGNITGTANIGGIVGLVYDSGTIRNCYHNGTVTGGEDVGGIAGAISFNKYNNDGDSTLIENSYHVNGDVTGDTPGAIVGDCVYFEGKNNTITIRNCFASSGGSYAAKNPEATYDNTMILPDSLLRKIAEDLGSAYTDNPDTSLNNGFPVFSWQISSNLNGDTDNNGIFDINDAIMLQEWLLGSGELVNWENADLCKDGEIDVFDMIVMRNLIVEKTK